MDRGQTTSGVSLPEFLAGVDSYKVKTSETKIILAHRKLQINATLASELGNSALPSWFIVASASAGALLDRTDEVRPQMSQSGRQIRVPAAPSLTPAKTPAMLEP